MKYLDEFRNSDLSKHIIARINNNAAGERQYRFMEFCGGHTHAFFRYGLVDLLPANVQLIHGPGCPVCVLPVSRVDLAVKLAMEHRVILCSYGDMLRVPGSNKISLLSAKAAGADVRMVYSCSDALTIAQHNPSKQVVFFAIGFETTTPPSALIIEKAKMLNLNNFSVYCNHVLTPAAITSILESPELRQMGKWSLDGFVGPAHVSVVIGSQPYEYFAEEYQSPVVIAGFEPLDLLQAIDMLISQVNTGTACVENEYSRAVTRSGNEKAKRKVANVFELRKVFEWRGLGSIPYSALKIKDNYSQFDAEKRFQLDESPGKENKACLCPAIIRGIKKPWECPLFDNGCTPANPIGSCMVSSEGACAAHFTYDRFRHQKTQELEL